MPDKFLLAELTQVFRDVFGAPTLVITPHTTADDIAGWDSIRHVSLMIAVEAAFEVTFAAAEIRKLNRVGDLFELIERKTMASAR